MWHLIADVWQGFADNATLLMFAADEATDPGVKAALEAAAQYDLSVKVRMESAMVARGLHPADEVVDNF